MATPPNPDPRILEILRENEELRKKLTTYKALEEDLMAQRVFEKTQSRMKAWVTIGGLAALISGIVGYKAVLDYSKRLVDDQLKAVTTEHIESVLLEEGKQRIGEIAEEQRQALLAFSEQQKLQISLAGSPVGGVNAGAEGSVPAPSGAPPPAVDYTGQMQPVRDQGNEGSSVAFALAAALEYQIHKTLSETVRISPRFLYYYVRQQGNLWTASDSGGFLRDGVAVLKSRGAVAESAWPYRAGEFALEPPASLESVRHYKIRNGVPLSNLAAIKTALASYGPVVAGITLYRSSFDSPEVSKTGRLPMPAAKEQAFGGQAICIVGYDDRQGMFKFQNSWGTQWGDHGYGYLPYAYVEQFSSDNWALVM